MRNEVLIQAKSFSDFEVPDFPRIRKVLHLLKNRNPGLCVDLGYCRGSFADYLLAQGWRCIGIDIVRRITYETGIYTIQSDLFGDFPILDNSVDLITAGELIEHMTDETIFLQECWRVLKPGGWLALTTPNMSFLLNRVLVPLGKMPMFVYAPYHYRIFNLAALRRVLQESGFNIKHTTSSHILYSTRKHPSGKVFEALGDLYPTFGAHLIVIVEKN